MISALHQRFPDTFTLLLTTSLSKALQPPNRQYLSTLTPEQREKEETSRISKQRTYLRISVELWLAGVLRNVEDGVSSSSSNHLESVQSQKDGVVAGLISSSSQEKKKLKKENDNPTGFVYRVLRELVKKKKKKKKKKKDKVYRSSFIHLFFSHFSLISLLPI